MVLNAAVLLARAAAMPDIRGSGLGVSDFAWMAPADKAHLYTQNGVEGIASLWRTNRRELLTSGAVVRLAELIQGSPSAFPLKPPSTATATTSVLEE